MEQLCGAGGLLLLGGDGDGCGYGYGVFRVASGKWVGVEYISFGRLVPDSLAHGPGMSGSVPGSVRYSSMRCSS